MAKWLVSSGLLACLVCGIHVQGADQAAAGASRAAEIERQRAERAGELAPDDPDRVEQVFQTIKRERIVERVTEGVAGFRVRLGGLITGSGFAAGPEYYRSTETESVIFRTSARGSVRKFYLLDAALSLPRLAGDRMFADFYAIRRYYPHIDYYGPGNDSDRAGRTSYRFEDVSIDVRTGVKPVERLKLGVIGRYMLPNTGPGTDSRFAPTEEVYGPALAPGILRQSDYLAGGGFAQFDYRDYPGSPRRGGNYLAEYVVWSDREFRAGSFNVLHLEAQQYIPFLNEQRVIALRARTMFADPRRGQFVPFYLQPTLGGSDDLRGYRPFRFHDNNSLVMNAEYRWVVSTGLDMALFADAGQVFHRVSDFGTGRLHKSAGFGFRFNVNNNVFLRLDTGFSSEGVQVWFKFDNVF